MILGRDQQFQFTLIGFGLVLVLAWICYEPAISADFLLDDDLNLGGLAHVEDAATALDYTLSGNAGPSGRPLALITFALQAESWPERPAAFLRVNVLMHLSNAVLVFWCLYLLGSARVADRQRAVLVAGAAAGIWVLLPLLATSSMMIVQRMTTLSAFFALLGLGVYLAARKSIEEKPIRSLTIMSVSLVVATILAALCKESGLLLPVLVLVMEATVFVRPASIAPTHWRIWQAVFLMSPLIVLLGYLASVMNYPESLVLRRGFTAWERLLTEAQVLWLYVHKAFLGLPGQLGIYQSPPPIHRSLLEPMTFTACFSWLALLASGVTLRRRYPLAAFAVLWFLAAHLIESTVVPLELYFEHRNYLAMIAPIYVSASLLMAGSTAIRRVAIIAVPGFLLLNAYFLYSFASLWGQPSMASRYWASIYPESVRAVTHMATYQLEEEGPLRALQTIDEFVIRNPEHAYLRIQELNLLCMYAGDKNHGEVLAQLDHELPRVTFTYSAGKMLSQLFSTVATGSCKDVDSATVATLAELLRGNPLYAKDAKYNRFHHKLLAGIARHQGDYVATLDELRTAMSFGSTSELNMMMVTALGGARDFDAAHDFIDDAERQAPLNPVKSAVWRRDLAGLRAYIRELESTTP